MEMVGLCYGVTVYRHFLLASISAGSDMLVSLARELSELIRALPLFSFFLCIDLLILYLPAVFALLTQGLPRTTCGGGL